MPLSSKRFCGTSKSSVPPNPIWQGGMMAPQNAFDHCAQEEEAEIWWFLGPVYTGPDKFGTGPLTVPDSQTVYRAPPPYHLWFTYSRRFLAEFTWSRLLRSSFHVHALPAVLCWTLSCRRHHMQWPQVPSLCSWGSGGVKASPAGLGQWSGRGPGGKAPWSSENLAF